MMSPLSVISLVGVTVFSLLWFITPNEKVYETIEFDIVPLKRVFGVLALVCAGFFLASVLLWN